MLDQNRLWTDETRPPGLEVTMRQSVIAGICAVWLVSTAVQAHAALTRIGKAVYQGVEYSLIWDDDNNGRSLIWLDYANPKNDWDAQKEWAEQLSNDLEIILNNGLSVNWGSDQWRLPGAGESPAAAYGQITSELGHLFYEELDMDSFPDRGYESIFSDDLNAGLFDHLRISVFWAGTSSSEETAYAWGFNFFTGQQYDYSQRSDQYAMAVNQAQVTSFSLEGPPLSIPVPASSGLLLSGFIAMAILMNRRCRKPLQ